MKGKEWNWTAWDSVAVDLGKDITLGEFLDYFKEKYNLEVSMLSQGVSILYSFFANAAKVKQRKAMPLSEVCASVGKTELPENQMYLVFEVICNDIETDEDVEIPFVK